MASDLLLAYILDSTSIGDEKYLPWPPQSGMGSCSGCNVHLDEVWVPNCDVHHHERRKWFHEHYGIDCIPKYECPHPQCGSVFEGLEQRGAFEEHSRQDHGGIKCIPSTCHERLADGVLMAYTHLIYFHGSDHRTQLAARELSNHETSHSKMCTLSKCGATPSPSQLKAHVASHGINAWFCRKVGDCISTAEGFSKEAEFEKHVTEFHQEEFYCQIRVCPERFDKLEKLRDHTRNAHPLPKHPYACEKPGCTASYITQTLLNAHAARHYFAAQS